MQKTRVLSIVFLAATAPAALAQFTGVIQERALSTQASVNSGDFNSDSAEAPNFGPFFASRMSTALGNAGTTGTSTAFQDSAFTASLISGQLNTKSIVSTGTTFDTAEADGSSTLLFIFTLAVPTPINFTAAGELAFTGRNPNGEPSDLFGVTSVRLINGVTEELISGFTLNGDTATDSVNFNATLPAGQYVILARATMHAFSGDLIGPPFRAGSGDATATFALSVVPAPASAALLGLGTLTLGRRRR